MLNSINVQSGFALTPSDTVNAPNLVQAIWVGTSGDITVVDSAGSQETFKSVPVGMFPLNFLAQRVMATGTTASDLVGFTNGVIPSSTTNYGAFAVTPSDTVNLLQVCDALYVGVAGNISLQMASGIQVLLKNVPAGWLAGIGFARIYATNTTATNMVAVPNTGLPFGSAESAVTFPEADARYGRLASANTWSALQTFAAGLSFGQTTLSYYEEGTFTLTLSPATGSITIASQDCTYQRIGNRVNVTGYFLVGTNSSATGTILPGGLPYAANARNANLAQGDWINFGTGGTVEIMKIGATQGASTMRLRRLSGTSFTTAAFSSYLQSNSEVEFQFSYVI